MTRRTDPRCRGSGGGEAYSAKVFVEFFTRCLGRTPSWRITWQYADKGGSGNKESACNARDLGSIPGSGRSPGEGHGNPLQYSHLESPRDGGAWGVQSRGVSQSQSKMIERLHTLT